MNSVSHQISLTFLLCLVAGCVHTSASDAVRGFVQTRELCDHLRGEIPDPDSENPEGLELAIDEANEACAGTDAALDTLKARYEADVEIMRLLSRYEERIEANPRE